MQVKLFGFTLLVVKTGSKCKIITSNKNVINWTLLWNSHEKKSLTIFASRSNDQFYRHLFKRVFLVSDTTESWRTFESHELSTELQLWSDRWATIVCCCQWCNTGVDPEVRLSALRCHCVRNYCVYNAAIKRRSHTRQKVRFRFFKQQLHPPVKLHDSSRLSWCLHSRVKWWLLMMSSLSC